MTAILGSGDFTYRVQPDWAKLPAGWDFGDVGGVGVDRNDNVYVFSRGGHPMTVFDREGNFLKSWGEDIFNRPHAVEMLPDDTILCADDGDHTVRKCTLDGKVLMTIGTPGKPAEEFSGKPFNRPTHTATSPEGDIYISDGYGNARVHKYSADGKHISSWGEYGSGPGEFNIVHNICCDAAGYVYVADRENHRVQVFDPKGKFEAQWVNLHRSAGLCMDRKANPTAFFVAEYGPFMAVHRHYPNLGPRVSVLDRKGNIVVRLGGVRAGTVPGTFIAPHTVTIDSRGDMYVGEVSYSAWTSVFPDKPKPARIVSLTKLVKVK